MTPVTCLRGLMFFLIIAAPEVLQAQALRSVRPWMGVGIEDGEKGVRVDRVLPGTPAEKAGLQAGDVISAVNKTRVQKAKELIDLIGNMGVGHTVTVHFFRNSQARSLKLTLVLKPDSTELMKKNLTGKPAPGFSLSDIYSEKKVSLKDGAGKINLLMFWATWCPACKSTMPEVKKLAGEEARTLRILTVSDEDAETQKGYFGKSAPSSLHTLHDPESKTAADYYVPGLPAFVVVDQKGVVTYVGVGGGSYFDQVIREVKKLTPVKKP